MRPENIPEIAVDEEESRGGSGTVFVLASLKATASRLRRDEFDEFITLGE